MLCRLIELDAVARPGHRRISTKPSLQVYSRIDVVPAERSDGFTPRRENGRVYGRSAGGVKGITVAPPGTLRRLRGHEYVRRYVVRRAPTCGESIPGRAGVCNRLVRPEHRGHGVDEFVYESDLDQLVEVLARFLAGDQEEAA